MKHVGGRAAGTVAAGPRHTAMPGWLTVGLTVTVGGGRHATVEGQRA